MGVLLHRKTIRRGEEDVYEVRNGEGKLVYRVDAHFRMIGMVQRDYRTAIVFNPDNTASITNSLLERT